MKSEALITKKFLERQGFRPVPFRNINDDSDPSTIVVYQKGELSLMNFGPCWIVCETGFGGLLLKGSITTIKELVDGMNNHGLALDWNRYQ